MLTCVLGAFGWRRSVPVKVCEHKAWERLSRLLSICFEGFCIIKYWLCILLHSVRLIIEKVVKTIIIKSSSFYDDRMSVTSTLYCTKFAFTTHDVVLIRCVTHWTFANSASVLRWNEYMHAILIMTLMMTI